jgi:hypothetical protein
MLKELKLKKEYLLVAASIAVLFICYQLAFKKTIAAWKVHHDLQKQITESGDVTTQPGYLVRKNFNLNNIINLFNADTINFRSNILSSISLLAERENVKLSEVPSQDPVYHTPQFIIQKLNFEGDYFALLKTLNRIESTRQIGMVRSAGIRSVKSSDYNSDKKKLVMEVYMEFNSK